MSTRRPITYLVLCAAMLLVAVGSALAETVLDSKDASDWAAAPGEPDPGALARQAFDRYCAACHAGPANEPVNFLNPAEGSRGDAVAQCAERIAFRLVLWDWPEALRPRAPMPPADWLRTQGLDDARWSVGEARAALRVYMGGLLALTGSSIMRVEQTGSLNYEQLRPCLAADAR